MKGGMDAVPSSKKLAVIKELLHKKYSLYPAMQSGWGIQKWFLQVVEPANVRFTQATRRRSDEA
ncbi:hypothetical protein NST84_10770 [Paenibacillus sp. FSL R7-0345]|uniref:hypothetical protein n=1 Tax=Paenibacillus sp. FSL R7-0345 TaxID=2954535 RepID=UPI00315A0539